MFLYFKNNFLQLYHIPHVFKISLSKLGRVTSLIITRARISMQSVHRCETSGSMRACQAAGPGSIPGRYKFPG